MFGLRHLRHLEERVKAARAEAEKSRASLEETRERVINPSTRLRERNHFAAIIRDSLLEGRGH